MKNVRVRPHSKQVFMRRHGPDWEDDDPRPLEYDLPPMVKRITREAARPILRELGKLGGKGAFKRAELVGSVATRGSSEKDLDILVVIDPSKVGVQVKDLDEFYEWLNSEEGPGLELVEAIHGAMGKANAYFMPGSDPDPESWVLVYRGRSMPVDLWYGWEPDQ